MSYLLGIAASSSPDLPPTFEQDSEERASVEGRRDFLAQLNRGRGRELLDAYIGNRNVANRNALAVHYGLCAQVVARQIYRALTPDSRRQVELGDVEQTAMALLFQLVEKFDCSLGTPLSAFLTRRLRYALIDEYRRQGLMVRAGRGGEGRRGRRVPLERGGKVLAVEDRGRLPLERMIDREGRKALLRQVPREYRLFVVYRFVRGWQLWQVAKRLDLTYERAGRVQDDCLRILGRVMGVKGEGRPVSEVVRPSRERAARGAGKREVGGVLPVDLQRAKEFRRWMLLRVPWAYRKLVAYRYLRGRDIDWTASKLGICPNKARVLDRQARPMVVRVVEEYQGGVRAVA